ncbi:MAG: TadA family conjugal transfer-associated ATPase [Actinomycetaceae bacterium]|nr:TadA family conjugal transfer-associated ATPase [Actinomycetaceae bacterium]
MNRWQQLRHALAQGANPAQAVDSSAPPLGSISQALTDLEDARAAQAGSDRDLLQLLATPGVSDVLVNDTQVWVDRGRGVEPVEWGFASSQQVRDLAVRMAAAAGARLDEAAPMVDATLPDGTRLHAALSPPALHGPVISLRTARRQVFTVAQLRANGCLDERSEELIRALVRARANVVISGATGSGKTTVLSAILSLCDPSQRLLCLEDVPELRPQHPHVVTLTTRAANVQGQGQITLVDLLRAAMRMRPDRIVLGECRGAEVREVLSAFNTGHEGGWVTLHANSAVDVPARLVALGALAGMSESTVHAQALSALDAVIHLHRDAAGRRQVAQIAVFDNGLPLQVVPAWERGRPGAGASQLESFLKERGASVV